MNTSTKSSIVQIANLVPTLILTKKGVDRFGWKGSFKWSNSKIIYRENKLLTAVYAVGLGVSFYYSIKQMVESYKEIRALEVEIQEIEADTARLREATEKLRSSREGDINEITAGIDQMIRDLGFTNTTVLIPGMEDMPEDMIDNIKSVVHDAVTQLDATPPAMMKHIMMPWDEPEMHWTKPVPAETNEAGLRFSGIDEDALLKSGFKPAGVDDGREVRLCQLGTHAEEEIVLNEDGRCPFPEEHDLKDILFTPLSERE